MLASRVQVLLQWIQAPLSNAEYFEKKLYLVENKYNKGIYSKLQNNHVFKSF
jgi:hypothetical protein